MNATPHADGDIYRWTRLGPLPRRGWVLSDVEDLEEPVHECEACGYPAVRYVHHLEHPDADRSLAVGCVCSEHLAGDYVTPRGAERLLRSRMARLRRLLDLSNWKPTRAGNLTVTYRGKRLILYRSRFSGGWRINAGSMLGRKDHPTPTAAIKAVFRFIDPPVVTIAEGTF